MNINLGPAQCASCGGKGIQASLRPYCSVVCRTLGLAGLAWRSDPYQIIDIRSGDQVGAGPTFDLTTKGILDLQKHANRKQEKVSMGLSTVTVPEDFWFVAERMNAGVELNA